MDHGTPKKGQITWESERRREDSDLRLSLERNWPTKFSRATAMIRDGLEASSHSSYRRPPENLTRHYTIGITFPNRTLDDNAATIKQAGLASGVVAQRWV
ncbi:hypothetical protein K438DRAFT_1995999 [Mycena galopus ATCC 62051]|nr:hypothetical protein K438DRAFT_1995999 [Mycena galopus ATCC 62051]